MKSRGFIQIVDFAEATKSRTKSASAKFTTGFTLIELMLSVALLALVAGIGIPVYKSFQDSNDLDISMSTTVEALRRAQTLSMVMDGDSTWGVHIGSGDITVFRGASYAGRNAAFDEVTTLRGANPSGIADVVFSKLYGIPNTTGTITYTSNANEVKNITINAKGMLEY